MQIRSICKTQRESDWDIEDVNLIFFFFFSQAIYLLFFPTPTSQIWNFVSFSPWNFSVSHLRSSLVLKQIITDLKVKLSFTASFFTHSPSFYSCLTCSSLKNIFGQPEIALHEEIFWGGNRKTRVRFRKPCRLTAIREVHSKNIISDFLWLKNRFK